MQIGLLFDPEATPAEVARHLDATLSAVLSAELGDTHDWQIRAVKERLPPAGGPSGGILGHARVRKNEEGWDLALCITDTPLRDGKHAVVADADLSDGVAVVSLPGFGAMFLRKRVRRVVIHLVGELTGIRRNRPEQTLGGRFHYSDRAHERDGLLRIVANRANARLLIGLIRDNRPWRLVFGLTGALAAALATGAYVVVTSTVWDLADALGPLKLSAIAVFAVLAMVGWLILDHDLWERPSGDKTRLFNASTLLTLILGVLWMYVGLFTLIYLASLVVVEPALYREAVGHPMSQSDRAIVAWMATSLGVIAGALGTGFESEQAVRDAVYSYRERQRQADIPRESENEGG